MHRKVLPAFCLLSAFCPDRLTLAQSAATTVPAAFSPLAPALTAAPPAQPAPARALSPATAARLATNAPKYVAPDSSTERAHPNAPDLRETDRPRNTIIRLPDYVVRQSKPATIITEDQVVTLEGKLERTYARHRGLRAGSFWIFKNDVAAREILEDDERVARRSAMNDLLGLLQVGSDPAVERSVRAQIKDTFIRPADWVSQGGSLQQAREKR